MKYRTIILFVLLPLALAACDLSLAEDITPPPGYQSPTPQPTLGALYPSVPPRPAEGEAIYNAECAACHGVDGLGNGSQAGALPVAVPAIGLAEISRQSPPAGWYTLVTSGRMDRYMPPFASLSEQQRWDVLAYVYSLSYPPEALQRGAALYAEACADCHGADGSAKAEADFTDQPTMAQMTGIAMFRAIREGTGDMPAFPDLGEDDAWALAAYVRSLSFDMTPLAATATPAALEAAPAATEVPPAGTETPAAGTETAIVTGTVAGSLVFGSQGALPAGLTVTLRGFDHSPDGSDFTEAATLDAEVRADGAYTFQGVELPEGRILVAEVEMGGVGYQSEPAVVAAGQTEVSIPPLTIYQSTTDITLLQVDQVHIAFEFSQENILGAYEIYILTNPSDQAVVIVSDGESLPFIQLPEGAQDTGLQLADGSAPLYPAPDGFAMLPGEQQYGFVAFFSLAYDRKVELAQPFVLPVESPGFFVPEGVKVRGDTISDGGVQEIQGTTYQTYTAAPVAAGGSLTFTVSGAPKTAGSGFSLDSQSSLLIGVGAFGVAGIATGVWLFLRDRARASEEDAEDEAVDDALGVDTESLMDAIAALDDLHKSGGIAAEAYHKRRDELKARLKDLL